MNNFCSNCGNQIIKGSNFCDKCGTKIDNNDNNQIILKEENNGLKTASLILGIISLVLALFLNFLIIPLAIVGLILGIVYTSKSKKFCVGIVLNILGIIIPIILCIFLINIFTNINSSIESIWDEEYSSYDNEDNYYNDDNDYYYDNDSALDKDLEENFSSSQNAKESYFKMTDVNEIKNFINNKESFILVITQTGCSHCIKYKPKVENIANKHNFNIYYIEYDLLNDEEKRLFSNYISFEGTPTTEFFNNGVENKDIRIVGNVVSEEEFEQILINNKYIK